MDPQESEISHFFRFDKLIRGKWAKGIIESNKKIYNSNNKNTKSLYFTNNSKIKYFLLKFNKNFLLIKKIFLFILIFIFYFILLPFFNNFLF